MSEPRGIIRRYTEVATPGEAWKAHADYLAQLRAKRRRYRPDAILSKRRRKRARAQASKG